MPEITRDELAERLFCIATRIARRYRGWSVVDLDDLIQETMLKLVPFIESHQGEDVYLFGLVDKAMNQAMYKLLKQRGFSGLSDSDTRMVRFLIQTKVNMTGALGYEPSSWQLGNETKIPQAICERVFRYERMLHTLSLDAPILNDSPKSGTLADRVADLSVHVSPEEMMLLVDVREQIERVLHTLKPLEEAAIKLRYGFINRTEYSQYQTARELKISVADERCLEITAMRKLRHPSRSKYLEPFLY